MEGHSPDFESIKQISPYEAEYWSARDLAPLLGYSNWQNFDGLVRRAQNLIKNGAAAGVIRDSWKTVTAGYGATRRIVDYSVDREAVDLLKDLASSYKLTKHYCTRNETVLLTLLEKYCKWKGLKFRFQAKLDDFAFDALIENRIAVEFDEPHHRYGKNKERDSRKAAFATSMGLHLVRFDLTHDIVDMIVEVEKHLSAYVMAAYGTPLTA
jgi:very-short-patch-repair endonuclease